MKLWWRWLWLQSATEHENPCKMSKNRSGLREDSCTNRYCVTSIAHGHEHTWKRITLTHMDAFTRAYTHLRLTQRGLPRSRPAGNRWRQTLKIKPNTIEESLQSLRYTEKYQINRFHSHKCKFKKNDHLESTIVMCTYSNSSHNKSLASEVVCSLL